MELEVGMYVRTKDKKGITYIRKLTKLANEYPQKLYGMEVDKEIHYVNYLSQKNILKASHNIIDIIEVGDYVNGKLVAKNKEVITTDNIYIGRYLYEKDNSLIGGEEDIKSIVTKEQFESMSYKVGE